MLTKDESNRSVVTYLRHTIRDAIQHRASDIHFEPLEKNYRIRMRIDGILHTIDTASTLQNHAISSCLKIMANLDIAEKRLPQDGRFTFTSTDNESRDCRLSSCPTLFGEKIVLRLLNPHQHCLKLNQLGLEKKEQSIILNTIKRPQGFIIVTGPTGSGKTITLYTLLNLLNESSRNITTIEDPIEIHLPGINQINIHQKIGLNFATTLRALLRQDPDIIMVGEIRDKETADMAIRAAQTGHLVLSTLHTNGAAETIRRLTNMGISTVNIADSIQLIVAQRLLRVLCPHCKKTTSDTTIKLIHDALKIPRNNQESIYEANQCNYCRQGYQGRIGIFEIMPLTTSLKNNILKKNTVQQLTEQAVQEGMQTLYQSALRKVTQGYTSLQEVSRVISV